MSLRKRLERLERLFSLRYDNRPISIMRDGEEYLLIGGKIAKLLVQKRQLSSDEWETITMAQQAAALQKSEEIINQLMHGC